MNLSIPGVVGQEFAARVDKLAQNVAKTEGQGAVELIKSAGEAAPPVGVNGEGANVNTYA